MKKILILLAATMLVFACGGNSGKKSEKQTVEETTEKQTVEETAVNYLKKLMQAQEAYDFQAEEKIYAEMQEWYEGLSAADKKKADNAADKFVEGEYAEDEEDDWGSETDCYAGECAVEEGYDDWGSETDCYEEVCAVEDEYVDVEAIAKKAAKYNERMLKALLKGDMDAVEKIQAEGDAWYDSLSDAEQEVADEATEQWMEEHADELEELL